MAVEKSLDTLRSEIDRLDEDLHDLLMKRAAVVERIGALKEDTQQVLLRPGREAEIVRKVVARHRGKFPKQTLIRIWRELISGMCAIQGQVSAAVYMPERGAGYLELARDHYGAYTPMTALRSAGQVVRAVAEGSATVGVLPMPDREEVEPWWISLMGDAADLPRIVTRLPFGGTGVGRGDGLEALVVARQSADATGYDRAWIGVETTPDVSRARLRSVLGAAGLEPTTLAATQRAGDGWLHLVEIAGPLSSEDRRISRLVERREPVLRCALLGGYPVPLSAEDLNE
ncbi:MAG TPA: chorismate mutase [Candidatus Sulfotelmatobacter sp.]|jgi:chorismate mutase|nr:chorismate mutase [Candidatus Sulfotelmatobacter sp.]